jgi:hypothetical protein
MMNSALFTLFVVFHWRWDSSVGIAAGYGLDGPIRFPEVYNFSFLCRVQTGTGAHPAS